MQRYIAQVDGNVPVVSGSDIWRKSHIGAIIIADLYAQKKLFPQIALDANMGKDGYVIKQVNRNNTNNILLYANTPQGLVNAVYGFLQELGFEFNLGSEVAPSHLPDHLSQNTIIKKPAFELRGVLPWYNFFDSPTTWDIADHRAFVDELIRGGANFITFHCYDNEPFAAVKINGKMMYGDSLHNTNIPTWGTASMAANEFMFGTNKLYDTKYFGAATTQQGYDESTEIEKEKEIMRNALLYAKSRGLKTSIGFEATGDPTVPADRERFIEKFTAAINYYNFMDYIFVWQLEARGTVGVPLKFDKNNVPDSGNTKLVDYGEYRHDLFKRVNDLKKENRPYFDEGPRGKLQRQTEAPRMEMFAKIAVKILARYKNAPKLVISGWGGQSYLLSEEYDEGLDKLLPADVAFSSLANIHTVPYIDRAYFDLPKNRQRWPIPWLEYDGDQWHPQPFIKTAESMANDLLKSGSQGFLTIHWRTRDVEDNFGYLLNFAWNPGLTRDQFYENKTKKYEGAAQELKQINLELDDMGYRWIGGGGQGECANFNWNSGTPEKLQELNNIKARLEAILPKVKNDKADLIWLIERITYIINYQYAETQAELARDLLQKAKKASESGKKLLSKQANAILSGDALAKAMHSYADRITTRGEYGVLATMNTKAAYDWRKMYKESCDLLGIKLPDPNNNWHSETKIIVPRLYGSCNAGEDLELKAIVLGGKQATFKYRTLGNKQWKAVKMSIPPSSWVQTVTVPARDIAKPGLEYAITVNDGNRQVSYGPKAISVISGIEQTSALIPKKDFTNQQLSEIKISDWKNGKLLEWNDLVTADSYQVFVDNNLQIETPVNFFPMTRVIKSGQNITVKAVKGGVVLSQIDKVMPL